MIVLYTNHCPLCDNLKDKLDEAKLTYEIVDDVDLLIAKGFSHMPMLETEEGSILNYKEALQYIEGKK